MGKKEGQDSEGWNKGSEMAMHRLQGNGKEANMDAI